MGVKSTVTLTREQAENKHLKLFMKMVSESYLSEIPNKNLEDLLEAFNDLDKGGEGFENYLIEDGE